MMSRIDTTIARMMPCSTPTAHTTTAVTTAIANSSLRRARIRLSPGMSIRSNPMRNTMPARTDLGMFVRRLVK